MVLRLWGLEEALRAWAICPPEWMNVFLKILDSVSRKWISSYNGGLLSGPSLVCCLLPCHVVAHTCSCYVMVSSSCGTKCSHLI